MYLIAIVLLHIPMVQRSIGSYLSDVISKKIGSEVHIGRIDLGFFNRLIIDDVLLADQNKEKMLTATRLSVKIDLYDLAKQKIDISSIQMFGLKANIYKEPVTANYNFQFVIDSLQSKEKKESAPLDLQIRSLIIRNGSISFRQQKERLNSNGKLLPQDVELSNVSAHILLNKLTNDSLSLKVKRLSVKEQSGAVIENLTFHLEAGCKSAMLSEFVLAMPKTYINIDKITATYSTHNNKIDKESIQYVGAIESKSLSLSDFGFLLPKLRKSDETFALYSAFNGTASKLNVSKVRLSSSSNNIELDAEGTLHQLQGDKRWNVNFCKLYANAEFAQFVCGLFDAVYPKFLNSNKNNFVSFTGKAGGHNDGLYINGKLATLGGNAEVSADKNGKAINASFHTGGLDLGCILADGNVGKLSAKANVKGILPNTFEISGIINNVEYKKETYENIKIDAFTNGKTAKGQLSIDDKRGRINANGEIDRSASNPMANVNISIKDLKPYSLGVIKGDDNLKASLNITAQMKGCKFNDMTGVLKITDMAFDINGENINPQDITVTASGQNDNRQMSLRSGFCTADIAGKFDYKALASSFTNIVAKHIHSLPNTTLKYKKQNNNNFSINACISDARLIKKFTGVNLVIDKPITINGTVNDAADYIDLTVFAPSFMYNDAAYKNASIHTKTSEQSLHADFLLKKLMDNGKQCSYRLNASASDNMLSTTLRLNDEEEHPIRGSISALTTFAKDADGQDAAHIEVRHSTICIGDTAWNVLPSTIDYSKNDIRIDNFKVSHNAQNITIDGRATASPDDSIDVHLKDIDISYILNLVNFHSVEFSGMATGKASLSSIFAKEPKMHADLRVDNFKFEDGRMGTLYAKTSLNNTLKQLDISAVAIDGEDRKTTIEGYVSPQRSDISLNITAHNTRLEFMKSFCSSFMGEIDAKANGSVLLFGPLSNINLRGKLIADGSMEITSLNTTYTVHNGVVRFIPDAIIMDNDTITDRNGNVGIVSGKLGHQHLTRLTYDLNIKAKNLLAYDTHTFNGNTFYGTAFVTGDCKISGRSGEVNINVNGTPEAGSIIVYNVASPDAISTQDFLTWKKREKPTPNDTATISLPTAHKAMDVSSDMHINFLINCTPKATIRLLMDDRSGDYITLNGHGVIKANYFNKGNFDMFGNYTVDTGHYRLTVQNFLKRDFLFQQGGTINFGGDPYSAAINLNALYTLASVSLADLNIGKSFTSNNTRVDCIMNITGTPASPHVDFSLDIPTISSDARQMIYSLMNSEEEMNQQVLYLLAVGRFLNQGRNNSNFDNANQQSQASLAMQSILSGTITQQVNEVIGNLTENSNWNFGANISTGTEGFNNAEYEGMLSGKLLSGRLLVDGQFGYRDNANATTSFIGDFDLKYLLYPNGNLAINFYNKTNDRYFTRNSLTTQGFGLLLKKDFSSLYDLFGRKRKKAAQKSR